MQAHINFLKNFKNLNLKIISFFSKIDIFLIKKIFQFDNFALLKNYRNFFYKIFFKI